jgi:hypothetical protein
LPDRPPNPFKQVLPLLSRRQFVRLASAAAALPLLRRRASARAGETPGAVRGWPFQLHLHAHSSHAIGILARQPGFLPSMRWHSHAAMQSGVNNLWWSEHDYSLTHGATWTTRLALKPDRTRFVRPDTRPKPGPYTSTPLLGSPALKITVVGSPTGGTPAARMLLSVIMSWQVGRRSQRDLRLELPPAGETLIVDLSPTALRVTPDNVIEQLQFTAHDADIQLDLEVRCRTVGRGKLFYAKRKIADLNELRYGTQEFISAEYAGAFPRGAPPPPFEWDSRHMNAYLPVEELLPQRPDYLGLVTEIHLRNGLAALNHPFGTARRNEAPGETTTRAEYLVQANCMGADLLEIGYFSGRGAGSAADHLLLWDLVNANGAFLPSPRYLAGVGVSDSHGAEYVGGKNATWIVADTRPDQPTAVELMRAHAMFFGSYEHLHADQHMALAIAPDGTVTTTVTPDGGWERRLISVPLITGSPDYSIVPDDRPVPASVDASVPALHRLELRADSQPIASTQHVQTGG